MKDTLKELQNEFAALTQAHTKFMAELYKAFRIPQVGKWLAKLLN